MSSPNSASIHSRMAEQLAQRLKRVGHPRVQMALIVSATGSAGFLLDWLMLKAGVDRMALRYAVAVLLAYGVFLLLIKIWLVFHRRRKEAAGKGNGGSDWGISSGSSSGSSGGGSSAGEAFKGGGGSSGGGGASASFAEGGPAPVMVGPAPSSGHGFSGGGGGGGGGGGSLDGDEILAILALLVALAAAFAAAIYLVVQAPTIFAEVLLNGSLSAGLYKRLNSLEHHSWLEAAMRKTAIPFAVVALLAGTAGHFAQQAAPEARSISGVWHHIMG